MNIDVIGIDKLAFIIQVSIGELEMEFFHIFTWDVNSSSLKSPMPPWPMQHSTRSENETK